MVELSELRMNGSGSIGTVLIEEINQQYYGKQIEKIEQLEWLGSKEDDTKSRVNYIEIFFKDDTSWIFPV